MKRPLIKDIDRWVAIKFPDSLSAARVELTIARAHLQRETGKAFLNSWIWKAIVKFTKEIVNEAENHK